MKILTCAILILLPLFAYGNISKSKESANSGWKISESSKVKNDFAASLILTPDKDWQKKWDTPSDVTPSFTEVETVKTGDEVTMLIFFANPKPDNKNNINIRCDIKAIRPDKSLAIDQKSVVCAGGKLEGEPSNIRLSNLQVKFVAEESDPKGVWTIEINIEDANRKTTLNLRKQYEFIADKASSQILI